MRILTPQERIKRALARLSLIQERFARPLIFDVEQKGTVYNPSAEDYRIVYRLENELGWGPWSISWENEEDQEIFDIWSDKASIRPPHCDPGFDCDEQRYDFFRSYVLYSYKEWLSFETHKGQRNS